MNVKRIIFIISVLLIVVSNQSCTTYRASERSTYAAESEIYYNRLISKIDVDLNKKVTGTVTLKKKYANIARDMAIWDALMKGDAHVVVDPVFKTTTTLRHVTVEVEGFSGYFADIHNASEEEVMDYIFAQLLSGNGILDVSWPEFKLFYRRLTPDTKPGDEDYLDDEALKEYYDNEIELAKKTEQLKDGPIKSKRQRSGGKGWVTGLTIFFGVGAVYSAVMLILGF